MNIGINVKIIQYLETKLCVHRLARCLLRASEGETGVKLALAVFTR